MGRIRHIKPEFFKHELLNDLENSFPHLRPMLSFAGLWCQCDANGVVRYKPRTLKNEIFPFIDIDFEKSLELLIGNDFLIRFESKGDDYVFVKTWSDHQHITAREKENCETHRKYNLPAELVVMLSKNCSKPPSEEEPKDNDLNLEGIPSKLQAKKDEMINGQWITEVCAFNSFDVVSFKSFVETWVQNKMLTKSFTYSLPRTKDFVIEDYKKLTKNGKPVNKKRSEAYSAL